MEEPEIAQLLQIVPEFAPRYLALVEEIDGEPGAAVAFAELAEYVSDLVAEVERFRPILARCLQAVESVAARSDEAEELVGWSFFDSLSPDDLQAVAPLLGPAAR